jgi:hypothetical protein
MISDLKFLLQRDLAALRREVEQYPDDASLWRVLPGTANPGGNLALHLAGNLQTFLGAQLAHTGYVRDRDREFAVRGLPRAEVLRELDAAAQAVQAGLEALEPADLDREIAAHQAGTTLTLRRSMLQIAAHLAYHLGQVNYHRRLATGQSA